MRAAAAIVAATALLLPLAPAAGAQTPGSAPHRAPAAAPAGANGLAAVKDLHARQPLRGLTGARVQAIADRLPKVVEERRRHPGSYPGVFLKGQTRWQVSYYTRDKPPKEIAQVLIDDRTRAVTEAYTGFKVAWTMARGYSGAFGRKVNSPVVWIALTVLFLAPFAVPRRGLRLLHLDLLVLVAFGASVAYFNDAQITVSVPLVYPLLAYLLARMLWIGLRPPRPPREAEPLALLVPATWLAVGVVFLVGFRIGLNVTNSNVIDVGYAGVLGADRLADGDLLYGNFPRDNEHGDTYGPVTYETYVPFEQALPWSGRWDDLPAAHGAAITFDLLCVLLLFLIGRRIRGPTLGIVLAYAWVSYPFTLYVLNTNANDALVAVFVLVAILAAGSAPARGAMAAAGGLTKFASLGLAPLLWTHDSRGRGGGTRLVSFAMAFAGAALIVCVPLVVHGDSPATMYDRTVAFQAQRGSPFSIWGLYDLPALQHLWQLAAAGLAIAVALVPRREDIIGLCACAAAVLIALQLGVTHWFYLYIVWFFPLAMIALLGRCERSGAAVHAA